MLMVPFTIKKINVSWIQNILMCSFCLKVFDLKITKHISLHSQIIFVLPALEFSCQV